MPTAYWGVADSLNLGWPVSWQGWLLLVCYAGLFIYLFLRGRESLERLTMRQWAGWLSLGLLALVASQLLPITLPSSLTNTLSTTQSTLTVSLLAAVPSLLAALILGPTPALFVGLSAGLGSALGHSHQVYDLFYYAFAAWLAAYLLHNNYHGRAYRALRQPPVTGMLCQGAIALMTGFSILAAGSEPEWIGRLDAAVAALQGMLAPLLVEGLASGLMVSLLLLAKPGWKPGADLVPSPAQRSVHRYLVSNLLLFTAAILGIVVVSTLVFSTFVTTRMVVAEMAAGANATAARMTDFQGQLENALLASSSEHDLLAQGPAKDGALGRLYRSGRHYDQVLFINDDQEIDGSYPRNAASTALSAEERTAVQQTLGSGKVALVVADTERPDAGISLVAPVLGAPDGAPAVLVARIKESSLTALMDNLANSTRTASAALVNADGTTIAQIGDDHDPWSEATHESARSIAFTEGLGGSALLSETATGARRLVYVAPSPDRNWRVAVSVPYESVLRQMLGMGLPVALALIVVAGVFYARLASYSRNLSGSITDLTRTSRSIAEGGTLPPPSDISRPDELGDLRRAFFDMHRGQKQRLEELSLLLGVSREVSTSIDLAESMPAILHAAVRATGATGVRALVLNPGGGRPLLYTEGPAAANMSPLDRPLMTIMRENEVMMLSTPQEIGAVLQVQDVLRLGIKAIFAAALRANDQFYGLLMIGFRQPRSLESSESTLLLALAQQAGGLVERGLLFTHAEGGRRRLAAILASTSEAVIVTDQTARIIVINSAMEKAFKLEARQVNGRAVADVLNAPALVKALSAGESGTRSLEIAGLDRRTYYANTSSIITHDGQALGRVAVLHDMTHLKELDRIKSEFVDNVSHDLRTPLTVLTGYAGALLVTDELSDEQRKYVEGILQTVSHMTGLVEVLLDLSKLEEGGDLTLEYVDMGELLRSLADEQWMFAHESGIRLRVRAAEDLPPVYCDRKEISRAISNLLANGYKYAPNSGDMRLAAELSGSEMIISIRDRGPGIAKTDQIRIFEKFYRVDRHSKNKVKGHGMGLALVKSIVELHGGQVWCTSELGAGSTFYISLPLT